MANHPIVHIEFSTRNGKESAQFYTDLFGWKQEVDERFDYWQFDAEGGPGGGFSPIGPGQGSSLEIKPGDTLVYVATDDIDASLAKAESLGGETIVTKSEIPGVGWYGVFRDPSGNKVGLYTSIRQTQ